MNQNGRPTKDELYKEFNTKHRRLLKIPFENDHSAVQKNREEYSWMQMRFVNDHFFRMYDSIFVPINGEDNETREKAKKEKKRLEAEVDELISRVREVM